MKKCYKMSRSAWRGRFYEDFSVGDIYKHPIGRTILDADNVWFTLMTCNPNPIHFDAEYAKKTQFGRPLVNSTFTLALVTGLSVSDVSMNGINLEWDKVTMPNPLFVGDTVHAETEVISKRESKSRPEYGIVSLKTRGFNQDGKVVIEFERTIMVYKREHAPTTTLSPE